MQELNTNQLVKLIQKDRLASRHFKGVYSRDKLPIKITYPASLIFNTDTSQGPGEHWIALYYNSHGSCYFYDPLGLPPKVYNMGSYLTRTSKRWTWNRDQHQSINSNLCGYFCFLFLILKARKISFTLSDNIIRNYFKY